MLYYFVAGFAIGFTLSTVLTVLILLIRRFTS